MVKDLRLEVNTPNKGFVLNGIQVIGVEDAEEYILFGESVEVYFNGGSFICGKDQEIKTGARWVKAKDLLHKKVGNSIVYKVRDVGVKELHDYSVEGKHSFKVVVGSNEFIVHNLPSIGGHIIGGGDVVSTGTSGRWYKYFPITKTVVNTKTVKTRKKAEKANMDIARLVMLGGTFRKIGEDDEVVGGGNQKVGTANQR